MNYIQKNNCIAALPANSQLSLSTKPSESQLPIEIILYIFSKLNVANLAICARVCKDWKLLAYDPSLWGAFPLDKLSHRLKILDLSNDLKPSEELVVKNNTIIPILSKFFSSFAKNASADLLTIPKALTYKKLTHRKGAISELDSNKDILEKLDVIPVPKTYRVLILRHVLDDGMPTVNYMASEVFKIQTNLAKSLDCEIPTILEVRTWLEFNNKPTYSSCIQCVEKYDGREIAVSKVTAAIPPFISLKPVNVTNEVMVVLRLNAIGVVDHKQTTDHHC